MSTDALTDLVFLGALPIANPSAGSAGADPAPIEPPTEPTAPDDAPADSTPVALVPLPATVDDKPMLCSKCGRPIGQDHFETSIPEGSTEPEFICGACLNGVKKPETPVTTSVKEHPSDKLIESVKEAARLRASARRFELKDVEVATTEGVEAIVASLEVRDVGDWKALGNLRKTLDAVIDQGQGVLEEFTRREYNERVLLAQRIRSIFGMKTSNIDLVAIQQARGKNGEPASTTTSSVLGRVPIEKREIPPDEPCPEPGCKNMVSGEVIANWQGQKPKGGLRCRSCYQAWKAKQEARRRS